MFYQNFILSKLCVAAPMGSDIAFSANALASEENSLLINNFLHFLLLTVHGVLLNFLTRSESVFLILRFRFLLCVRPRRTFGEVVLKLPRLEH